MYIPFYHHLNPCRPIPAAESPVCLLVHKINVLPAIKLSTRLRGYVQLNYRCLQSLQRDQVSILKSHPVILKD